MRGSESRTSCTSPPWANAGLDIEYRVAGDALRLPRKLQAGEFSQHY